MPKLTFTPNVPVQVALKFPDGKLVEGQFGDQMYYSLANGDSMYLPIEVGAKINALALNRNEPFWVCKRWTGKKGDRMYYDVYRIEGQVQTSVAQAPEPCPAAATPGPPPVLPPNGGLVPGRVVPASTGASVSAPAPVVASPEPPMAAHATPNSGNGSTGSNGVPKLNGSNGKPAGPPSHYVGPGLSVPPAKVPMDQAVVEAVRIVQAAMRETGEQWSDAARQDLVSTVLITAQREGWLALWKREAA